MGSNEHTPGPWVAEPPDGDGHRTWWVIAPSCICRGINGASDAEEEANALLIASAPELLASCHYIDSKCDISDGELAMLSDDSVLTVWITAKGLRDLRYSIAKTTGEHNGQPTER